MRISNDKEVDEKTKIEQQALKYGSIVFASVYVLITLIDLIRNSTTAQTTIVFCSFLGTEAIIKYKYTKNKQKAICVALYWFYLL